MYGSHKALVLVSLHLTNTIMAVHTFTQPSSLGGTLATAANMPAVRAEASAKENVQSFPAEAQAPLAHSTHPQSKPGITFADEDSLPKLPIPELEGSCEKYVAALKPLQSPKEHRDTVQSVSDFLKADGPVLQQKLKKYASGKNNYIEQFCKYLRSTYP